MAKEVKFNIKINVDGKEQISAATVDAKEFAKNIKAINAESKTFKDVAFGFNQVHDAIGNMSSALNELFGTMQNYIDASNSQVIAETKLQTIMNQRMGATEAQVKSIIELTDAQERLGVIEGDVQLMGAQQLATFLSQKESLDVLIPAMNNLVAQQAGVKATSADTIAVANMMGKAATDSNIILTLGNGDTYDRLIADTNVQAALDGHPNVTLTYVYQ